MLIFRLQNQKLKPRLYNATVILENEGKEVTKYVKFEIHTNLQSDGYTIKHTESGTADFKVQGIGGNFLPVFVSILFLVKKLS